MPNFNPFRVTGGIFVCSRLKLYQETLSHWPTVFESELQIFSSHYSCFTITYTCWSELIVLYNENRFLSVISSVFWSLNKFVRNTIDSVISSCETRQGQLVQELCSEEEFTAHQSVDSATNHDGGWCEFSTASEGNYQYLLLWKVVLP